MNNISPRLFTPPIPFHSIPFFHYFQSSKPFHSIPLFSTIFFNFPNPYTISLNLNHLYHLEICKVKPFSKLFFKPFSKPFSNHLEWSKMTKMVFPNTWLENGLENGLILQILRWYKWLRFKDII